MRSTLGFSLDVPINQDSLDQKGRSTMTDRIQKGSLEIAAELHDLVVNEIAPGTGVVKAH